MIMMRSANGMIRRISSSSGGSGSSITSIRPIAVLASNFSNSYNSNSNSNDKATSMLLRLALVFAAGAATATASKCDSDRKCHYYPNTLYQYSSNTILNQMPMAMGLLTERFVCQIQQHGPRNSSNQLE